MGLQNASYRDSTEQQYMGALNTAGAYSDKEFEINQMAPYMQHMAAASAMRGAGMQNFMGGTQDLFGGMQRQAEAAGSFMTGNPKMLAGGGAMKQGGTQQSTFNPGYNMYSPDRFSAVGGFNYQSPALDFTRASFTQY
jgi:hypothetical protein